MTHFELTYFRLYPDAHRVVVTDWLTGRYEYLAKNAFDAADIERHLRNTHGVHGRYEVNALIDEVPTR